MLGSVRLFLPTGLRGPRRQPWSSLSHRHPARGLTHSRCSGGHDGGCRARQTLVASGACGGSSSLGTASFCPPTGWHSAPPAPGPAAPAAQGLWDATFLKSADLIHTRRLRPGLPSPSSPLSLAHPPPTANRQPGHMGPPRRLLCGWRLSPQALLASCPLPVPRPPSSGFLPLAVPTVGCF